MEVKKISVDFRDHRGEISDIVTKENIGAVTVITTLKGAVRGNHFHKETWQYLYVLSGKLRAMAQMPGEEPTEAILLPGDLILDLPNQRHAFEGLEDSVCLVLTRGVREGNDYEKDTFRLDVPLIKPA